MKAQGRILWLLPLLLGVNVQVCTAASTPEEVPLCDLQRTAKQGEQRSVQVGGIYITGYEGSVLTDAACPSQSSWVELDLQSTTNKEMLRSMLDTAGKAGVVFEGEFYGPGVPDPKLPEAIKKSYQPGWGHLGAFRTKLVVHAIQSVEAVPADHPASADLSGQVPILQDAAMHEAGHTATSVTETGCVLSTASNGQTITVQGTVRHGPHDMGIDIPGCKEIVLLTFAGYQDNDVSGAELRRDRELRRFQKYTGSVYKGTKKDICMDCPKYDDVEGELTGKLEIATVPPGAKRDASGLLWDQSGKFIGMLGWGHPARFASYRLVIVSAAHVKARKLPPPNPNP